MKSKSIIKFALILLVAGVITSFVAFDLQQYVSLEFIKSQQKALESYYEAHTFQLLLIFGALYVFVTALSLPAATVLTLLGGAVFGFWLGLIMVSFASSIGATLAFLLARFLLKDPIQKRYPHHMAKINNGFEREGAFYLFALRLVPVFPFFMVNLVMGVLPIRTWTFYWVSQAGMLAGTVVYVYAGTALAKITSLSSVASPTLLLALTLLGIFPFVAKKAITLVRKTEPANASV